MLPREVSRCADEYVWISLLSLRDVWRVPQKTLLCLGSRGSPFPDLLVTQTFSFEVPCTITVYILCKFPSGKLGQYRVLELKGKEDYGKIIRIFSSTVMK